MACGGAIPVLDEFKRGRKSDEIPYRAALGQRFVFRYLYFNLRFMDLRFWDLRL
jgi:hypothetical protein